MKKNSKIEYIIFLLLITLMPFNDALEKYKSVFKYMDEVYLLILLFVFVIYLFKYKMKLFRYEKIILFLVFIVSAIGIFSSIKYKYQPHKYALIELIMFWKFIVAYFCARHIFRQFNIIILKEKIIKICSIFTLTMFVIMIVDLLFNVFDTIGYRFGLKAINLIFSHPTYLAGFSVIMLAFYTFFYEKGKSKTLKYILINIIFLFSTLRNKAIIFALVYLVIFVLSCNLKVNKSIKNLFFILAAISIFILFNDAINERLLSSEAARSAINSNSIKIAIEHFPFGAGLATFASNLSGKYYSPLYYNYWMSNLYGFTESNYKYIADSFWAMVVAQFGFLGVTLFGLIQYNFIRLISKIKHHSSKIACMIIITYVLISSTSEAIFNTYIGITLFTLMAIFVNNNILLEEKNEEKNSNNQCCTN